MKKLNPAGRAMVIFRKILEFSETGGMKPEMYEPTWEAMAACLLTACNGTDQAIMENLNIQIQQILNIGEYNSPELIVGKMLEFAEIGGMDSETSEMVQDMIGEHLGNVLIGEDGETMMQGLNIEIQQTLEADSYEEVHKFEEQLNHLDDPLAYIKAEVQRQLERA